MARKPSSNLVRFFILAAAIAFGLMFAGLSQAQVDNTIDPNLLRGIQGANGSDNDNRPLKPVIQVIPPTTPGANAAPSSNLEHLYMDRSGLQGHVLLQFGYDTFGVPRAVSLVQSGAMQDRYVLGPGDEIIVQLRGQENSNFHVRVDREGKVVLPKLNPITAAGRTLGDFRADLEAAVAQAFVSTSVFVSIGDLRQITVSVTGDVRAPGTRIIPALASPIDAIVLSGGISKTGSLRAVQVIHGSTVRQLDLYAMLVHGGGPSPGTLQDGDKIFVPPIGATVAIAGVVKHEGIFELPRGTDAIGARELMRLAGGVEIAGAYRLSKVTLERDGTTRLIVIPDNGVVRSGEILFVDSSRNVSEGRVSLIGAVRLPGLRSLSSAPTVGQLIRGVDDLSDDAYTLFALVVRRDPASNAKQLLPFSLYSVFHGGGDIALRNDDSVYVFSSTEIASLSGAADENGAAQGAGPSAMTSAAATPDTVSMGLNALASGAMAGGRSGAAEGGGTNAGAGGSGTSPMSGAAATSPPQLGALRSAAGSIPPGDTSPVSLATRVDAVERAQKDESPIATSIAAKLGVSTQTLARIVADHLVWVLGEVGDPRAYIAAPGTRLGDMLATAGGALRDADLSSIEITSTNIDTHTGTSSTVRSTYGESSDDLKTVSVQPFDVIRLRPVFSDRQEGSVVVAGAVRYPGRFDITREERLSSLLARAGGLTEQAYPYGAVFTRRSVALEQKNGNEREARAINSQLATLVSVSLNPTNSGNSGSGNAIQLLSTLVDQLRNEPVTGRMSVIADPAVLAVNPQQDILLEPGDSLFIPARPSTVNVSGEVLSAGAFRFDPNLSTSDYIRLAGGATESADLGRTFVLLPDGAAETLSGNWLSFDRHALPPGSTIIVPRDLRPFDLAQFLTTATQILSQLAITAASLSVVVTK